MSFPEAPLVFDNLDRDLYIERPEVEFWLRSAIHAHGGGWLLLGPPGAGKTTLLRWLEHELAKERASVAWVDAGTATDASELIELIAQATSGAGSASPASNEPHLLQARLRQLRNAPRTCVLMDNLTSGVPAFDLFGRMRDLVWASGHTFIVTGRRDDIAVLRRPPADAFFSHTYALPTPDKDMLEALALHAEASSSNRQRLVSLRPPSLRAAVRYLNSPASATAETPWRDRLTTLTPAAASVAEQMLELGRPVTPSDTELQARTGLGEIALRRYLRSLQQQGLLRVIPERTAKPGRPRLVYEPDVAQQGDS
jgi:hypothetical protein